MNPNNALLPLESQNCQYAFYFSSNAGQSFYQANHERFYSASIIKVPILLAWIHLERSGEVNQAELCRMDDEPQVQGAGFSWLMRARQLPYQDVLLMMIALSDNLCTNLVIRRAGLERLNRVFREVLGLKGTELQRKLMDYEARSRGLDNWITAQDCIRLFDCLADLSADERRWVDTMLDANTDNALLMRDIPRDTLDFCHKTGSMTGVLHDWGYTNTCRMFLLTQQVNDEVPAFGVFGQLGRLMIE